MASKFRLIADALAAGLQAADFSSPVTVTRANWIELDSSDLQSPTVIVTPGNADVSRIGRDISQIDYSIHVFVALHCESDSDVDAIMDIADSVFLYVRAHAWPESVMFPEGVTGPIASTIDINPDDGLTERNIWRAMIATTYRVLEQDALP